MQDKNYNQEILDKYQLLLDKQTKKTKRLYFISLILWASYLVLIFSYPQVYNSTWILAYLFQAKTILPLDVATFSLIFIKLPKTSFEIFMIDLTLKILFVFINWLVNVAIRYSVVFQKNLNRPVLLMAISVCGWFLPAIVNAVTFLKGSTVYFLTVSGFLVNFGFVVINWFHFILLYELLEEKLTYS